MLAPPPPILLHSAASLDDPSLDHRGGETNKVYRSNSCVSDSGAYLVDGGSLANQRGPRRAYLLRQKATGEETVVTLTPLRPPVAGARTLVTQVPTFVATGSPVKSGTGLAGKARGFLSNASTELSSSLDDQNISYRSSQRRHSELQASPDALETQRLQKLYSMFRRQASGETNSTMSPLNQQRLDDWLLELESRNQLRRCSSSSTRRPRPPRRQSCAMADFLNAPGALSTRRGSRCPRKERAHSHQGSEQLMIPRVTRAQSQQGRERLMLPSPRIQRAHSHQGTELMQRRPSNYHDSSIASLKGSSGSGKLYPTTSRRCSEAVAAYAMTGDLEAAAQLLKSDRDLDDDTDTQAPPEKERRRMAVVVSCVALLITILAAAMVGLTLGLSHVMDEMSGE